jgi:Transglycosylase SLT domain
VSGTVAFYENIAAQDAAQYGVPVGLFENQIQQESGFNPDPSTGVPGGGIAQIEAQTAADPGYGLSPVDPDNPEQSLQFAAQYDAALYQQTGSWTGALQAYGTTANGDAPNLASQANAIDNGAISNTAYIPDALGNGAQVNAGINNDLASQAGGQGIPNLVNPNSPSIVSQVESAITGAVTKYGADTLVIILGGLLIVGAFVIWGAQIIGGAKSQVSSIKKAYS